MPIPLSPSAFCNSSRFEDKIGKTWNIELLAWDFGIKNSFTYIDGADEDTRYNYLKRHYYNPNEKYFIDNLIISPSLLSYYITWGTSHDINENIKILNQYI